MPVLESLRDIRLFVAVYEERSFTAAADRENATQSGVSQHIRKVEDRFGVRLFTRQAGAVRPTPAGDHYYGRCIELLRLNEDANRAMRSFGDRLDGDLRIGLMPTLTRCATATTLDIFGKAHPNVSLRIVEGYSGALTQQVLAGDLEFAIVPAFPGAIGLRSRLFHRTPELLVSRRKENITGRTPGLLCEIGPLKIVLPSTKNVRRNTLDTYFSTHDVRIERLLELDTMLATLDLVAKTDWVTVLPGIMMADTADASCYSLSPLIPRLETELVLIEPARLPPSPAALAFLEILERVTTSLDEAWAA